MKTKEELKLLFKNRIIPDQEDFWEWMDSYWHKEDDIPTDNINVDVSSKADKNAGNITAENAINWKQQLGITEIPIQLKVDGGVGFSTSTLLNGYTQNGKNIIVNNGANNISIACDTNSESDFVATYVKVGSGEITFKSSTGTLVTSTDGVLKMNGSKGSRAMVCRVNSEFLIYIQNV